LPAFTVFIKFIFLTIRSSSFGYRPSRACVGNRWGRDPPR
jgi:hypothetical protein